MVDDSAIAIENNIEIAKRPKKSTGEKKRIEFESIKVKSK